MYVHVHVCIYWSNLHNELWAVTMKLWIVRYTILENCKLFFHIVMYIGPSVFQSQGQNRKKMRRCPFSIAIRKLNLQSPFIQTSPVFQCTIVLQCVNNPQPLFNHCTCTKQFSKNNNSLPLLMWILTRRGLPYQKRWFKWCTSHVKP